MEPSQQIRILQLTYASQLADSLLQYEAAGVLERVTAERRATRLATGAPMAAQLGITEPAAAFTTSAELFGCADWTVRVDGAMRRDAGAPSERVEPAPALVATARTCLLCAMAKKAGGPSPCRLYCLDPIEAMVRGLVPGLGFEVEETLYDGAECRVRVGALS